MIRFGVDLFGRSVDMELWLRGLYWEVRREGVQDSTENAVSRGRRWWHSVFFDWSTGELVVATGTVQWQWGQWMGWPKATVRES